MNRRRHLLVVDDLAPVRAAIRHLFGHVFRLHFAATGAEALEAFPPGRPDAALVDLRLPDLDGVELTRALRARHPGLPVVVQSVADDHARIVACLRAGAAGFVHKEELGQMALPAIEAALRGEMLLPPVARSAVHGAIAGGSAAPSVGRRELASPLTERERSVLGALARGMTYEEAAASLDMSINTVRNHVRSLYPKLGAASKTEAVMLALEKGLLDDAG